MPARAWAPRRSGTVAAMWKSLRVVPVGPQHVVVDLGRSRAAAEEVQAHLRRPLDGLRRRPADPHRRMRPLQRRRGDPDVAQRVVLPVDRDGLARQQPPHDREAFLHPPGALAGGDALIVELARAGTRAHAEVEPAAGDEVQRGGVLRDPDGVVQRKQQQERPDANPTGPRGDGGADRQQRGGVAVVDEVVLGEPRFVETHLLGVDDEVEVRAVELIPRYTRPFGIAERPQQAEPQRHRRVRRRLACVARLRTRRSAVRPRRSPGRDRGSSRRRVPRP